MIRNLGLDETPEELLDRVDVEASEGSSLVRIDVEGRNRVEARRAAQEVAEVATVLFNDRFAPETTASVWEPAVAAAERVSPRPAPNLALGLRSALSSASASSWSAWARRGGRGRPRRGRLCRPTAPRRSRPRSRSPLPRPVAQLWRVDGSRRRAAAGRSGRAFPEQRAELEIYLDSFRTVAGEDGRLPGDVDLVLEDVFAPLIERARRHGPTP